MTQVDWLIVELIGTASHCIDSLGTSLEWERHKTSLVMAEYHEMRQHLAVRIHNPNEPEE